MNGGKIVGVGIVVFALIAGGILYFAQVYAYYDKIETDSVQIKLTSIISGKPETILYDDFQGIDSDSSPIRFRGCFTTPMSSGLLTETYVYYEAAEPLIGPKWFDCYDAHAIGADLEEGIALAFLAQADISDGVDRVVAIYPDGRGYVWHQLNDKYTD